jgi:hypothetical protein
MDMVGIEMVGVERIELPPHTGLSNKYIVK